MALQLTERILFVVGKGGVGKTTAACALALASADRRQPTYLLSTDPAHSISDVLGEHSDLRSPTTVACSEWLTAEALDAAASARAFFDAAGPALVTLVEQGTYLEAADARTFLDLSLPGVDEVMAALRIAELFEIRPGSIVIDTAPTGHTLRLLDAARVLDGWISALTAMADKAGAVAAALLGRPVTLPAEALIEHWTLRKQSFERALSAAGFIVVTRDGAPVTAETDRLIDELRRRGLRHCATIITAPDGRHDGWITIPWLDNATGCDALRAWWAAAERSDTARHAPYNRAGGVVADDDSPADESVVSGRAPVTAPAATAVAVGHERESVREWLLSEAPGTLLFAGKGGVGKTTCAAAVSLLTGQAETVHLVSTDPAGSLGDVLETTIGRCDTPIGRVTAVQIDAAAELRRVRGEYGTRIEQVFARLGIGGAAVLDRRVIEALWDMAPPGIDEIMAVVHMLGDSETHRRTVVDTAPTGHFLNLLAAPRIALEWTHALLRVLLKYRAVASLDEASRNLLQFARDLRALGERLADPARTGVILVALDETVVWQETRRLHESLIIANIPVAALVLNRADAGPARGLPLLNPQPRIIRAPYHPAPAGRERLLEFVAGWEFLNR